MTVDEVGRPMAGCTAPSPSGVQVELHRDWLNLRDPAAFRVESGLPRPVVATITDGEITYQDVDVVAARGPGGIYFACWTVIEGDPVGMVGIGCDGRDGGRYVGVRPAWVTHLAGLLSDWHGGGRMPARLGRLDLSVALRFCQGDGFVSSGAGFPTPCTPVGQAQTPLACRDDPQPEEAARKA